MMASVILHLMSFQVRLKITSYYLPNNLFLDIILVLIVINWKNGQFNHVKASISDVIIVFIHLPCFLSTLCMNWESM
jgi:hypothetical protein